MSTCDCVCALDVLGPALCLSLDLEHSTARQAASSSQPAPSTGLDMVTSTHHTHSAYAGTLQCSVGGGALKWSDDKDKVEYYKSSNECCSGHHPWRATGWLGCRAVRPPWPGAGCARPARLERGLAGPPLPSPLPPSIAEQTGDCRVICAAGRGRGRPVSGLETRYWISTQIAAECDTGTREVQELGSIVTTDVATWCELHWNCS